MGAWERGVVFAPEPETRKTWGTQEGDGGAHITPSRPQVGPCPAASSGARGSGERSLRGEGVLGITVHLGSLRSTVHGDWGLGGHWGAQSTWGLWECRLCEPACGHPPVT